MKLKEFDILLDIKRNKKVEEFEIVQGDYETNILKISLVEDFNEYELSGLSVEIAFAKSDGTTVLQDLSNGISLIGNKIVCTLKTNTIASPGKVLAEVRILEGLKLLTSSRFSFFVRQSIVNDKTIESTNEFPLLERLTNDVTGIIATESARVTAEDIRKIDEIDRNAEEEKRVTAEQQRATTFEGYEDRVSTVETDLVAHKEDYIQQRQQDQLKVAKVEKDINDYQSTMATINPNQEAKQKVTGHETISLPKTAANGQVSVGVKGLTYTNLQKSTVYGSSVVATDGSNVGLNNDGTLKIGSNSPNRLVTLKANCKYYIRWKLQPSSISIERIRLYSDQTNGTSTGGIGHDTEELSLIHTPVETQTNSSLVIRVNGAGNVILDHVLIINLTSIGLENLTKEECDKMFKYITNTKSTVSASRLKSVGKNMFNKNKVRSSNFNGKNAIKVNSAEKFILPVDKYIDNQRYTLKFYSIRDTSSSSSARAVIYYTDGTDETTNLGGSNSWIEVSHTTQLNKTVRGIEFTTGASNLSAWIDVDTLQVERGIISTSYEPYTESTQYIVAKKDNKIVNLRSLPNGVKDEIRMSEGEAIIRSKKYTLQAIDLTGIITVSANVERINTSKTFISDADKQGWSSNAFTGKLTIEGWVEKRYVDSLDNIGTFYTNSDNGMTFLFAKGTTLEQARTALAGLTLTYQLAEPEIIPVEVSGTLLSNPSDTVYVENVVADAGIYTTKFNIKELQLPIKSIDKLIKYNFETGVPTVLDINLAAINEDKKSFTHPSLANKDMVFVDYFYDVESTLGETTIEYFDSRHTIKDSVNNKFYKWDIKATNGIPTVVLTEVL